MPTLTLVSCGSSTNRSSDQGVTSPELHAGATVAVPQGQYGVESKILGTHNAQEVVTYVAVVQATGA